MLCFDFSPAFSRRSDCTFALLLYSALLLCAHARRRSTSSTDSGHHLLHRPSLSSLPPPPTMSLSLGYFKDLLQDPYSILTSGALSASKYRDSKWDLHSYVASAINKLPEQYQPPRHWYVWTPGQSPMSTGEFGALRALLCSASVFACSLQPPTAGSQGSIEAAAAARRGQREKDIDSEFSRQGMQWWWTKVEADHDLA